MAEPNAGERTRWRDLLAVVAPLLGLVSVLAFGVVHVSYEHFYAQFGIEPEDVGASSATVLAQSGSHVVAYVFLFAVVPYGLTLGVFVWLAPRLEARGRSRFWAVAPALVPMAAYQELTRGGIIGGYMLVTALALVAFAWATAGPRVRQWHAALLWFSTGIFFITLFYLPSAAARAGECVVESPSLALRAVHTKRRLPGEPPLTVLVLRAQPAEVHWLGEPDRLPSLGDRMTYLGQAGGITVLYDGDTLTTIRLPTAETAIVTRAHAAACPDLAVR
ncbi:MAG TPA: hypothetical protein VF063_01405 [Gaiellaceae bacterium]